MPKKVPAPKVVTLPQADAAPLETLKKVRNAVVVGTRKLKKKEGKLSGMRVKLAKHVGAASTVVALLSQFKTAETLVDGIAERMDTPGPPKKLTKKDLAGMKRLTEIGALAVKEAEIAKKEASVARSQLDEIREQLRSAEDGLCRQVAILNMQVEEARKQRVKAGNGTSGICNYRTDPLYDNQYQDPFC